MTSELEQAKPEAKKKRERKFEITIALGNDKEPVRQFIGADGRDFLIERGKKVVVPECVLSVLDDAVYGDHEQDPTDPEKLIPVQRQRFAYTVHREV